MAQAYVTSPVDLSDGRSFAEGFPHAFFAELRRSPVPYWHPPPP